MQGTTQRIIKLLGLLLPDLWRVPSFSVPLFFLNRMENKFKESFSLYRVHQPIYKPSSVHKNILQGNHFTWRKHDKILSRARRPGWVVEEGSVERCMGLKSKFEQGNWLWWALKFSQHVVQEVYWSCKETFYADVKKVDVRDKDSKKLKPGFTCNPF